MAAAAYEVADEFPGVRVEVLPGLTAAQAVAARAGAPLGADYAVLSLSDRLKPWDLVERRLRAAAEADLVLAIYNPASRSRDWQVAAARDVLLEVRGPETVVVAGPRRRPGRGVGGRDDPRRARPRCRGHEDPADHRQQRHPDDRHRPGLDPPQHQNYLTFFAVRPPLRWSECENFHSSAGHRPERRHPHQNKGVNDTVRRHLLRQAGVISRRQALESGLTSRQIERLLRTLEWLPVHPGVYRLHAAVPTPETALRAASLWLGPEAFLTDGGAAWWWEVPGDPPQTWTFASVHRCRRPPGLRVVQAFVDPRDQTVRRDVPVVSRPWAVLRAAAARERGRPGDGIALLDGVAQTHKVPRVELERAFERHPGCWGAPTIRTLLRRTGDGAHSELERLAVTALQRAGITGFEPNLTVRLSSGQVVEIDIAFVDQRIALELDGFAFHSSAESFRYDRRRGNTLMADGWTVRRFTFDDLLGDPDGFIETVLELLAV